MAGLKDYEQPWIEKYRPHYLKDAVGNQDAVKRPRQFLRAMCRTCLSGPPGVGKTTTVLCLARETLGEAYKNAVLELNASDARGIDVVRNKIKLFAQKKVNLPVGRHKIIILDEADSMTSAAQQALRRTMEYIAALLGSPWLVITTKIIEPIQSMCGVALLSAERH